MKYSAKSIYDRRAPEILERGPVRARGAFGRSEKAKPYGLCPYAMHKLFEVATARLGAALKKQMPCNAANWGAAFFGGPSTYRGRSRKSNWGELLSQGVRVAGWIQAVAERPQLHATIARVLKVGISDRGIGSGYHKVDPVKVALANPSPGRVNRKLAAVQRRANEILSPYGLRVSLEALARAAEEPLTLRGRNAFRAARRTIAGFFQNRGCSISSDPLVVGRGMAAFLTAPKMEQLWILEGVQDGRFADLRQGLEAFKGVNLDNTDGVQMLLEPLTQTSIGGAKVTTGMVVTFRKKGGLGLNGASLERGSLVRLGNRSYHSDVSGTAAVRQALAAWRTQDLAAEAANVDALEEGELAQLLLGEHPGIGALLNRQHSYAVGNCVPGTEAWISSVGFGGKDMVPLHRAWSRAGGSVKAKAACRYAARQALNDLGTHCGF